MPFLTRNENQSHVRYAAPARPMTPSASGAPAASTATPAPAATAATAPLRLATILLRCTSDEAITVKLHHEMPPVKPWPRGHSRRGRADTAWVTPRRSSDRSRVAVALGLQNRRGTRDKKE